MKNSGHLKGMERKSERKYEVADVRFDVVQLYKRIMQLQFFVVESDLCLNLIFIVILLIDCGFGLEGSGLMVVVGLEPCK